MSPGLLAKLRAGTELALGYPGATLDRAECSAVLEVLEVARELDQALARERGGGTPLDRAGYIDLHRRARAALEER